MRRSTVAVCLDDEGGMMFNNRRQSRDRVMIEDFLNTVGTKTFAHTYSEKLFLNHGDVFLSDNPFDDACDGACVFVENLPIAPYLDEIEKIVIYRWNRLYPADIYFDLDLEKEGFKLIKATEFKGSSHERITKGIYTR